MLPADVLQVVLLLLQFEDVPDEELLQVLVGEVDAKLLETTEKENQWKKEGFSNDDTSRNSKKIFRCQVNEPKVTVSTRHAKNKSPVDDEVLKTKDVEQPDRPAYYVTLTGRRSVDGSIDLINNPDKQPPVDPLEEETHVSKNIELQFFYGMFTVGLGRHPY